MRAHLLLPQFPIAGVFPKKYEEDDLSCCPQLGRLSRATENSSVIVKVVCPNPQCGQHYNVPEEQLGQCAVCNRCKRHFTLNASERETTSVAASAAQSETARGGSPVVLAGAPKKLGRFELCTHLGAGAFGAVYRARDPLMGREVAIKVPHRNKLQTDDDKAGFLREAQVAGQLRHPNIVPVYEAGAEGDTYYIASAFIEGLSLRDAIERERPDIQRAVKVVMDLAGALDYAHGRGIIHRDVKPANIMLDAGGEPLLTDFGLARMQGTEDKPLIIGEGTDAKLTQMGAVFGTPAYMAPEQAAGHNRLVGPMSDQYALGVVLYELLTGETPFSGPPGLVISNVIHQPPPLPRSINAKIPRDLEVICLKAMSKVPGSRYATCADFAADLHRWRFGLPIQARTIGSFERLGIWCRRKPTLAAVSAAAAILLVVVIAVTAVGHRRMSTASAELGRVETILTEETAKSYSGRIALVQRYIDTHDYEAAQSVLDAAPVNLRGWEHHFLQTLSVQRGGLTMRGHKGDVRSVCFSPDGKQVVSGGCDQTLKIWDAVTGKIMLTLGGHAGEIETAAWSPDGKRIASGSWDKAVKIWDANTGRIVRTLTGHTGRVWAVAWSPDGKQLVSKSEDSTLKAWDVAAGQEIFSVDQLTARNSGLAYSPDGKRIFSGGDRFVTLDASTGKELPRLEGDPGESGLRPHSADGKYTVSVDSAALKIWDAATGNLLLQKDMHVRLTCAAISPDGTRVVVNANDGGLRIWDAFPKAEEPQVLDTHDQCVCMVLFSPDGKWIATGGSNGSLQIWDAFGYHHLCTIADGIGSPHFSGIAFSPDGGHIAWARGLDDGVTISDSVTGRVVRFLKMSDRGKGNTVHFVAYSTDGKHVIASGWHDVTRAVTALKIWDAVTGQEVLMREHAPTLGEVYRGDYLSRGMALSPDGSRIVSCSDKGELKISDLMTGDAMRTLKAHNRMAKSVVYSPDGNRLLSGGDDQTLMIWDASTGQELLTLKMRIGNVSCAAYSPDGKRIAASGVPEGTLTICDAFTGEALLALAGPKSQVPGLGSQVAGTAFSPDGKRIAACYDERNVLIWDAEPRQQEAKVPPMKENQTRAAEPTEVPGKPVALTAGRRLEAEQAIRSQEAATEKKELAEEQIGPREEGRLEAEQTLKEVQPRQPVEDVRQARERAREAWKKAQSEVKAAEKQVALSDARLRKSARRDDAKKENEAAHERLKLARAKRLQAAQAFKDAEQAFKNLTEAADTKKGTLEQAQSAEEQKPESE